MQSRRTLQLARHHLAPADRALSAEQLPQLLLPSGQRAEPALGALDGVGRARERCGVPGASASAIPGWLFALEPLLLDARAEQRLLEPCGLLAELGKFGGGARAADRVGRQRLSARSLQRIDESGARLASLARRRRVLVTLGSRRCERVEAVAVGAAAQRDVAGLAGELIGGEDEGLATGHALREVGGDRIAVLECGTAVAGRAPQVVARQRNVAPGQREIDPSAVRVDRHHDAAVAV